MGWLDIYNGVGTFCSIIGLGVSFYSLWLVRGIDARLDEYKERRTYLDKRDELRRIISSLATALDVMMEHNIAQSLTRDEVDLLLIDYNKASSQLAALMVHFESNAALKELVAKIVEVDAKQSLMGKRKEKARADIGSQKEWLALLEKRFDDELDRTTG